MSEMLNFTASRDSRRRVVGLLENAVYTLLALGSDLEIDKGRLCLSLACF